MQHLASLAELLLKTNRPLTPARAGAAAPRGSRLSVLLSKVKAAALCLFPVPLSLMLAGQPWRRSTRQRNHLSCWS